MDPGKGLEKAAAGGAGGDGERAVAVRRLTQRPRGLWRSRGPALVDVKAKRDTKYSQLFQGAVL